MTTATKVYTTRKMPTEVLKRLRLLAAWLTAEREERVTVEQVVNEALQKGLPALEERAFKDTKTVTTALAIILLVLQNGDVHACERLEAEMGMLACFTQCHDREPVCRGDAPFVCDVIDIIHPPMVREITLVHP